MTAAERRRLLCIERLRSTLFEIADEATGACDAASIETREDAVVQCARCGNSVTHEEYAVIHAACSGSDGKGRLREENAALIAAAPDLLAALRDAWSVLTMADRSNAWREERDRCVARAYDAIEKAMGGGE